MGLRRYQRKKWEIPFAQILPWRTIRTLLTSGNLSINEDDILQQGEALVEIFEYDLYHQVITDQAFKSIKDSLLRHRDSLSVKEVDDLTDWQPVLDSIQKLDSIHAVQLSRIRQIPYFTRQKIRGKIDSLITETDLLEPDVDSYREKLLHSKELSLFQKLLVASRSFTLGNTFLEDREFSTASLPVKGIQYQGKFGAYQFSTFIGHQAYSGYFLPSQGLAITDRQLGNRIYLFSMTAKANNESEVQIQYANVKDRSRFSATIPNLETPVNQLIDIGTTLRVTRTIGWQNNVSYTTILSPDESSVQINPLNQLALSSSLQMKGRNNFVSMGVFRVGGLYKSLLNPFLITDFEGITARVRSQLLKKRVRIDIDTKFGRQTGEYLQPNSSWRTQLRGSVFVQLNPAWWMNMIAAPNYLAYPINNEIYQSHTNFVSVQSGYNYRVLSLDARTQFSVSNLDQAFYWSDTSQIGRKAILSVQQSFTLSEGNTLGGSINRAFSSQETNYGTKAAYELTWMLQKKWTLQLALRLDRRFSETGNRIGGRVYTVLPIGGSGSFNIALDYRRALDEVSNANNQFFGTCGWQFNL